MRMLYCGKWSDQEGDNTMEFSVLAAGDYPGTITDLVWRASENSGYDYIQVEYTLDNKRKVWDILSDSPNAHKVVRGKLSAFGFTSEEKDQLPDDMSALAVAIHDKIEGVKFNVNVGIREAQGDFPEKNIVKYVKKLDASDLAL